jgi:hypothetical protein
MRIVCGEEINLQVSRKATDFMDINIQISIYENVSSQTHQIKNAFN